MRNFNNFVNVVEQLNEAELKIVANKILKMLSNVGKDTVQTVESISKCRKCDSSQIVKFGKDKNGKQRYKCHSCGATFTSTSFSVVSHSHCHEDKWEEYIKLLLQGSTLEHSAKMCHISIRTAFLWRHKILSALQQDQDTRAMCGIVEADDMFFAISYKGNHKNSKKFVMPRAAFKRGSDNHAQIGHRACVMCAVERKGHTYGEVLGVGLATQEMLSHAFKDRLAAESLEITDKANNFKKYFEEQSIELVQMGAHIKSRSQKGPPEVRGVYHIQNVNNLHHRFRQFLQSYNGVATKYLNHYLNLYIWIENHKKIANVNLSEELKESLKKQKSYLPSKAILDMPALPSVA